MRAGVALLTLLAVAPRARAEPPLARAEIIDSVVWTAHFEGWVDRLLSSAEIEAARRAPPVNDPDAAYRVLLELTQQRALSRERVQSLPDGTAIALAAGGITGEALRAGRMYAEGHAAEALEVLKQGALARDPAAVHLRAQLRDETERDATSAWQRLDIVHEYRLAISLGGDPGTVARARVRIAQIQLELDFAPEARAALRLHLDGSLPAPYAGLAALTYAEAAMRGRDYRAALDALDAVPRDQLSAASATWLARTSADAHFRLEEYAAAAAAYQRYSEGIEASGAAHTDPITLLRWGFSLLRSQQIDACIALLSPLVQKAPSEMATLLALLLVEAHGERREHARMQEIAQDALARQPDGEDAPLAGLFVLESQRLRGLGLKAPDGVAQLAEFDTSIPAHGLLAFRIETGNPDPSPSVERRKKTLERLASLARSLPDGPVKALVHDELALRLIARLRKTPADQGVEPSLLDTIDTQLNARQIDENGLLLVLDAFRSAGRFESCASWALALQEREVRPLRRGLGSWRKMQCERPIGAPESAPAPPTAEAAAAEHEPEAKQAANAAAPAPPPREERLLAISDSGEAGPYSLAFAALAAEEVVRGGDLEAAVRVYERGLEAFAEPLLIGPVLLRLGELHAALGQEGIARQRLVRGLTLTEGAETAADPFRKIATVQLARLVAQRGDPARLREFLAKDAPRVDAWWPAAYAFLGAQVGLELKTPPADDPFSAAASEIERTAAIRARLGKVTARKRKAEPVPAVPAP